MKQSSVVKSLFGLYLFCCLSVSLLVAMANENIYTILFFETIILCIIFLLVPKIYSYVLKVSFTSPADISKKTHVFLIVSGIVFVFLLICYIGCYPGCFSGDTIDQYRQAVTGKYTDWHPAWHTILFFTLPLKLTHLTGSIAFFQIIYFSLFMGYFAFTIYLYADIVYALIATAFIMLGPFNLEIILYPLKDIAFAIAAGFSMLFATHIYFSKGNWCKKTYRIFIFAFMLANATLFRHNGILFTFFLLLILAFFMQKKKYLLLVSVTVLIFLFVHIGVYSFFNVKKPGKRIQETMGVPLTIITSVVKDCSDRLNDKTLYFVEELTKNQPKWKSYHNSSGFNSIKYGEGRPNNEIIEKVGVSGILKMTYHCFAVAPKQSLISFIQLTRPVFVLDFVCNDGIGIAKNELGIKHSGIKIIYFTEKVYLFLINKIPPRNIFSVLGFTILIMLSFMLFKTDFTKFSDWKRLLLCIPIFTYNFGTMLLLSGHDVRFFFINFLVCPIVVLIMARQKQLKNTIEETKI